MEKQKWNKFDNNINGWNYQNEAVSLLWCKYGWDAINHIVLKCDEGAGYDFIWCLTVLSVGVIKGNLQCNSLLLKCSASEAPRGRHKAEISHGHSSWHSILCLQQEAEEGSGLVQGKCHWTQPCDWGKACSAGRTQATVNTTKTNKQTKKKLLLSACVCLRGCVNVCACVWAFMCMHLCGCISKK